MKVEVEKQPDSVSTLRIELGPEQVAQEWDAIANSFARHAKIAGYRPGKAPRRVVEAKFKKEIQEELTKKLVSQSYRDAIAEKHLRVVSLTNLEDVQTFQYIAKWLWSFVLAVAGGVAAPQLYRARDRDDNR